jgi:cell division protein ZipA
VPDAGVDNWVISATRAPRDYDSAGAAEIEPAFAAAEPEMREPPSRRTRVEPTFSEVTAELPTGDVIEPVAAEDMPDRERTQRPEPDTSAPAAAEHAPTLAMSSTPQPRRIERRKIIALRLAAGPQRFDGAKLRAALEGESLQHGKYQVFHRLHSHDVSIFSIASMVEPGTFDLEKMAETHYPGVTLFAQLPGPVPGMHALNELVACARRLHQALGGTLQDDRGVPLTVHRIERLRQEVRVFERPAAAASS